MAAYSDFQRELLRKQYAKQRESDEEIARLNPSQCDGETNPWVLLADPYFRALLEAYQHSPPLYDTMHKTPQQKIAVARWAAQHWTPAMQEKDRLFKEEKDREWEAALARGETPGKPISSSREETPGKPISSSREEDIE